MFSPGGSLSNMYGMMLARHAKYPDLKSSGLFGQKPLVAFTSDESHYSIVKGANWLGIGVDNVVKVMMIMVIMIMMMIIMIMMMMMMT